MAKTFRTTRRVEFRDTDAAGIVHFSVFFAYMEQAEHEFLRSLGLNVIQEIDGQTVSWPRVHAECDYRATAKFEQVLDIEISVIRLGEKSASYQHVFKQDGKLVAEGKIVAACCQIKNRRIAESVSIPAPIREQLSAFLI